MEELIKLIDQAIEEEKHGFNFYAESAKKVQDKAAKRILLKLSQDELTHIDFLADQKKRVKKKSETSGRFRVIKTKDELDQDRFLNIYIIEDPQEGEMIFEVPAIKLFSDADAQKFKPDTTVIEILNYAISIEQKARAFYLLLAKKEPDGYFRELVLELSKVEEGHRILLADELKYYTAKGKFFDPFK